jgi:hypothetical protein
MRRQAINYLRFAGISAVTLMAALWMKLAPSAEAGPPEPRRSEGPGATSVNAPAAATEAQRLEQLEADVARLNAELVNLRTALELMGPLPEHSDLNLPVDPNASAAEPETPPDPLNSISKADLFAPPPVLAGGHSLFHEAELGSFRSQQAAEASWRAMARNAQLAAMTPRYLSTGGETRLVVGSLPTPEAVNTLCVELSAVFGACRPYSSANSGPANQAPVTSAPVRAH